ncbi:uncharacterized protein EDB93DRAFT_1338413 [Suillus bovinus]|uniref:uncharacterized protein n=1 Tax=Suillus bovinus TaxID=48563 RepID=UPI001B87E2DA|nr:uncharacterized protein EDB93DRAFT_1338413 [Suillus bovinus]KAG2142807.1 hypothetical protein EDB93DRAFT_1338413 [Suillus bovinus]
MYHQPAQTGQMPIQGPPQNGLYYYPPAVPQPPSMPLHLNPHAPELLYAHLYQQHLQAIHQAPAAPYPVPPPQNWGGYYPAFQGMGAPPAAAPPYYPVAPPLVQPPYNQPLEQPQQQIPVAVPEESPVMRGKRKAVDLDDSDSDAPPRKKQIITFDNYHFDLIQFNGNICYRCRLPQCKDAPLVPHDGRQDHINSRKHQNAPEYEANRQFSNIKAFCSLNQEETDESSQGPCEGSTANGPEEHGTLTESELLELLKLWGLLEESDDGITDSTWDEQFNEFFNLEEAAEPEPSLGEEP